MNIVEASEEIVLLYVALVATRPRENPVLKWVDRAEFVVVEAEPER